MKSGKKWPIPINSLLDGAMLSLKNAQRLLKDAKNAKSNYNSEQAITQGILALEELGKSLILWECAETKTKVNKKYWHDNLENHEKKLLAIPKNLKKFTPKTATKAKKALTKMEKLLKKFKNQKLQAIYVDWDPSKNDWFLYSEKQKQVKRKDAAEVLELTEWAVAGYVRDGRFITERRTKIIEMVKTKQAHAFCKTCSKTMFRINEIAIHHRFFPDHQINFRR